MKKLTLSLIYLLFSSILFSQSPAAFKYQVVVRDNNGAVLANQPVAFRLSIHDNIADGTIAFRETHQVTTNDFGVANLEIGNGIPDIASLSEINWGLYDKYLEVELDLSGGTNFVSMGTTQLLSVPYALYSKNTGDSTRWIRNGNKLYYNQGNVGIGIANPQYKLTVDGSGVFLGNGYFVDYDTSEVFINLYNTLSDWQLVASPDTNRFDIRPWNGENALSIMADGKVGIGTSEPNNSSVLDLTSTNKGFLPPRMTTEERDQISSPAEGLIIFNTISKSLNFYSGQVWFTISAENYCSPTIEIEPNDVQTCAGGDASFTILGQGEGIAYQWQENQGTGYIDLVNNSIYSGVNSNTLELSGIEGSMENYQYRCIVNSYCPPNDTSNSANLSFYGPIQILSQPDDIAECFEGFAGSVLFEVDCFGTDLFYQWQEDTGTGFNNIFYNGYNTPSLEVEDQWNNDGNAYRCIISREPCNDTTISDIATLTAWYNPVISLQPINDTVSEGEVAHFHIDILDMDDVIAIEYDWCWWFDGCSSSPQTYEDLFISQDGPDLDVYGDLIMDGSMFWFILVGECGEIIQSDSVQIIINY